MSSFLALEFGEQLSRDDRVVDALVTSNVAYTLANSSMAAHQGPENLVLAAFWVHSGELIWQQSWGTALENEVGARLVLSLDGGTLYVTGSRDLPAQPSLKEEFLVVAFDTNDGSERWSATWDASLASSVGNDVANDLVVSADGNWVYVTGTVVQGSGDWFLAMLSNFDGSLVWEQLIAQDVGPSEGIDVELSADGQTLYCVGSELGTPTVLAMDASLGQELWRATAAFGGGAESRALIDETHSRLHVFGFGDTQEEVLVSYNLLTGQRTAGVTAPAGVQPPNAALSPDDSKLLFAYLQESAGPGNTAIVQCVEAVDGDFLWSASFQGPSGPDQSDFVLEAAFDASGTRALVTGRYPVAASLADTWVAAWEASSGASLWANLYDTNQAEEAPVRLLAHPSAPLCFTAGLLRAGDNNLDIQLSSYNTLTGERTWTVALDQTGPASERPQACVVDELGERLYTAGYQVAAPGEFAHLAAFDAAKGDSLWSERLPVNDFDSSRLVDVQLVDDRLLVTGWAGEPNLAQEFLQAAYEASTGNLQWVEQTPSAALGDKPVAADISADGLRWVAAGWTTVAPGQVRGLVRSRDPQTGAELWAYQLSAGNGSKFNDVLVSADGQRAYAVGELNDGLVQLVVVALDAAQGTPLWTAVSPTSWSRGSSAALSADGGVLVVTGIVEDLELFGKQDALTVAFDTASGSPLWESIDTVSTDSHGVHVAVDFDDERALVLGHKFTSSNPVQDLFLEARSLADGQLLWHQVYDGGAIDRPQTLHLSSQGGEILVGSDSGFGQGEGWTGSAHLTSFALEDGALLGEARYAAQDASSNLRALAVDAPRKRAWAIGEERTGPNSTYDLFGYGYELRSLLGTPSQLPQLSGGTQDLALSVGPAQAGRTYLILGSASAASGGPSFGTGLDLPLLPDSYLLYTLQHPNSSLLAGSLGVLDGNGDAQAQLFLPPGPPAWIGQSLWHACLVFEGFSVSFVSEAVELSIE